MANRVFGAVNFTPTSTADTTNLANSTYMAIGASGATAGLNVKEIRVTGLAAASSVSIMQFARDSTLGGTLQALVAPNGDGPQNTLTAPLAAVPLTFVSATTNPQRSAAITAARLNLGLNTFGGIHLWQCAKGDEWGIVGVTVNISESSLSAFTGGGTGALSATITYEPF